MTDDQNSDARKQRLAQKTLVTTRLSETTRFVGFGIIAWVFAVQSSDAAFSKSYVAQYEIWVNSAGMLALFAIACDYFQYLCAYFSVKHALTRKEHSFNYNKNHIAYYLQSAFFVVKQVAVSAGAIVITVTFALHVIFS